MHRGYRLNADDLLRREVIGDLMCHGRIDFGKFERRHGICFTEYFAEALAQLDEHVRDGLLLVHRDELLLLPQGHLMMRSAAMAFDAYLGAEQKGLFSRTV
ncbi:Oxygen-independent coproporphyrinogen-III oxidase [compost metagenome]